MNASTKTRIVVVEDDPSTRKLLVRQLEAAGYEVTPCADGRAALEPISAMNTGLVIADWAMPEMDGIELCRALREMQALHTLGVVHFILLTAHGAKEKVVEGLAAGANDYLTKPYHTGELLARVQVGERVLRLQEEVTRRNIELELANAQMAVLANELEQLANTDALTSLPNRRRLFEQLGAIWQATARETLPLSCIMIDLDHFKRVNDTHGHAAGDWVLECVADTIRRNARRPELCGRFGGAEFLLLLPNMTNDQAMVLAERIRREILERPVPWEAETIEVAVCCGVAQRNATMTCPDELLRDADAMLYLAKEAGRNQTWVSDDDGAGRPAAAPDSPGVAPAPLPEPRVRSGGRTAPVQSDHATAADE